MIFIYSLAMSIILGYMHQQNIGGKLLGYGLNYALIPVSFTALCLTASLPLTYSILTGVWMGALILTLDAIDHYIWNRKKDEHSRKKL